MSDDSFIREVDEELRQDQAKALWTRYGAIIIAVAVLVVAATAGWRGYEYWTESRANASGDIFLEALELSEAGDTSGAEAKLQELEKEGYGAYPVLARFRAATVKAEAGDIDAAVSAFDAVSNDPAIPEVLQQIASIRAALLLVDTGTYNDVAQRVQALDSEINPLRHSAREALGLAAWKDGQSVQALDFFDRIVADEGAPANMRQRAGLMAELIRGSGDAS